MTPLDQSILARYDRSETVAQIADAEGKSFGYVYSVLRKHRPDRARQPRTRTSKKREFILKLLARGIKPPRAAFLAECTPAYVYALIKQEEAA